MSRTSSNPPPDPEAPYVRRNFWAWVGYQFCFRVGWQFKMESTMMAGLISYLSPSPWVMGVFTSVNTIGRNLAPLVAAPVIDSFRYKRSALLLFWGAAVLCWAALTLYLWLPVAADRRATIWVFGACYTLFFIMLGASSVAQGALLGKIIPANMRGRAMANGMTISGVINVGAIYLMYHGVRGGSFPEPRNYALAFTLTVVFFLLAAGCLVLIRETPSPASERGFGLTGNLRYFVKLGRENRNLARLMAVNISVGILGGMLQFYTGFWRLSGSLRLESLPEALMLATVLQVFWQSLSSTLLGRLADVRGNRIIICRLLWVEACIPLAAIVLGSWGPFPSHWAWYLGVYALVGLRFPVYQLLVNYLLEVVPQHDHAMALGAVNAVQLVTAPAPLLFGAAAGIWGYSAAFVAASAIGVAGAIAAEGLKEVRVTR